ncbi:MAG: hypothetical protein Q8R72_12740 [Hylemonella sp.]|nr:hypothetical protein [Hylemonella sp.]
MSNPAALSTRTIGLYLAGVQFFLALGWIVYVIYLPELARSAGLEAKWIPWLLMADQLVFIVTDLAVGLASDRAARVLGRVGRAMVVATLLSCAAFLLLPWVARQGSPTLLVVVTFVWVVTSAALRAPPFTLLGRYVAQPQQPGMIALSSLGLGVAAAMAPYLGLQLKGFDPVLPFLFSALSLALVTLGMVAAERALAARGAAKAPAAPVTTGFPNGALAAAFLAATILGAVAFQWHSAVASAPLALRFAPASELPWLLPVFWVGFNLALWPASLLAKRQGPWRALVWGALIAAGGNAAAAYAGTLEQLLAAQVLAGAGWAVLLSSAFFGALALGRDSRPGLFSGALNSTLALAALARIAVVSQAAPAGAVVTEFAWLAAAGFVACALISWWLARHPARA